MAKTSNCCCFAAVRRLFTNSGRRLKVQAVPAVRETHRKEVGPLEQAQEQSQPPLQTHGDAAQCKLGTSITVPLMQETNDTACQASLPHTVCIENGFRTVSEIPAISVDPNNRAAFSLPQEVLTFQPTDAQIFARFKDGDSERMIHNNTPLMPEEQKSLQQLRSLAAQQNKVFYPSIAAAATRFLCDARGDAKIALEKMQISHDWRKEFYQDGPITDLEVISDLRLGVVYFSGRDSCMRPVIVVRPGRIPQALATADGSRRITRCLLFLLEYFLRYMAVPGKLENVLIMVDMKGLSMSQVHMSSLRKVAHVLSMQHAARVWKFYICNMPLLLSALSSFAQALMTDRQRQKVVFVKNMEKDLRKDFLPQQLENDLGGTRLALKVFFPFPMLPGPFEANSIGSDRQEQVVGCHELLTDAGARGRSWNPALSSEENTVLEYSKSAPQILSKCNLPIPKCMDDVNLSQEATDDVGSTLEASSSTSFAEEGGASNPDQDVRLDDIEVDSAVPGSLFSFAGCGCTFTANRAKLCN